MVEIEGQVEPVNPGQEASGHEKDQNLNLKEILVLHFVLVRGLKVIDALNGTGQANIRFKVKS